MREPQHDVKGARVYLLHLTIGDKPTDVIPFSDEETIRRHLCDHIARHLQELSPRHREKMILFLESKNYKSAVYLYQTARVENSHLSLKFFWNEKPSVVM